MLAQTACHPPRSQIPPLQNCFRAGGPNTQWYTFFHRCRNLHFSLLNFKRFLSAQFSSVLRPLQIKAQLSAVSYTHPRFVLYTDVLSVHSVPSSTSLMKMSHCTDPKPNPCGTKLVPGLLEPDPIQPGFISNICMFPVKDLRSRFPHST